MNKGWMRRLILVITCLALIACSGEEDIQSAKIEEPSEVEYIPWNCNGIVVEPGKEIVLFYYWESKTKDQNEKYFRVTEHSISIDGKETEFEEGLSGIQYTENDTVKQQFWANIGSFEQGTYEISYKIGFDESVYDGWDWYGPDSEYPVIEDYCTLEIGYAESTTTETEPVEEEQAIEEPAKIVCALDSEVRQDWDTVFCETFDGSTDLWLGDSQGASAYLEDGKYVIDNSTAVQQGYTTGYIFPVFAGQSADHMVSVDGLMESKFSSCTWGVFVRSQPDEIDYFFMISNEGRYMLTGSTETEASRYLGNIKAGSHNAIIWDGTNNITAVAEGKDLEFYVNGELLLTHEAVNSTAPSFGLIVWGGEGVTAKNMFDNLLVRQK